MTNLAALCCCSGSCACAHPICVDDYPPALYPSIGRPIFVTNPQHYAGVLWPAWWNGIHPRATLTVSIVIEVDPPVGATMKLEVSGTLPLGGTNGAQVVNVYEDSWGISPSTPCGPWPQTAVRCGSAGLPDAPIAELTGDPAWWPYRNRYLIPQWSGPLKVTVDDNSQRTLPVTINYPIAVVGNHTTCNRTGWQYGATEGAYGFDLCILDAIDIPTALKPIGKLGDMSKVWLAPTGDNVACPNTCAKNLQLRVLRGITSEIAANEVLRFGVAQNISQTGTEVIGGLTWAYKAIITLTPNNWCLLDAGCGCIQSYSEKSMCTMNAVVTIPIDNQCSGASTATGTLIIGLVAHDDVAYPTWENTGGYLGCRPFEAAMPFAGHVDVLYRNVYNYLTNGNHFANGRWHRKMPAPTASNAYATPPGCGTFNPAFQGGCTPVTLQTGGNFFCVTLSDDPDNQFGRCGQMMLDFACGVSYTVDACPTNVTLIIYPCSPMTMYWPAETQCTPAGTHTLYCGSPTTGTVAIT
jgi:hypothetical protein